MHYFLKASGPFTRSMCLQKMQCVEACNEDNMYLYICGTYINSVLASWIPVWYRHWNYVTLIHIFFWWLTFVEGLNGYLHWWGAHVFYTTKHKTPKRFFSLYYLFVFEIFSLDIIRSYSQDIAPLNQKHVSIKSISTCKRYHIYNWQTSALVPWIPLWQDALFLTIHIYIYIYFINFSIDPMNSFMAGPGCLIFSKHCKGSGWLTFVEGHNP